MFKEINIEEKIKLTLKQYYLNFCLNDSKTRTAELKNIANDLLSVTMDWWVEKTILTKVQEYIIDTISLKVDIYTTTSLDILFAIEKSILSEYIKNISNTTHSKKAKEIHESTLHLINASSSDILHNHINNIAGNTILASNLLSKIDSEDFNKEKVSSLLSKLTNMKKPIDELTEHLLNHNKLFINYKDEIISNLSPNDIKLLLEYVYKNSTKIKFPSIRVLINNHVNNPITIHLKENLLVNSIYPIYENIIESNAKSLTIDILHKEELLILRFSSDGKIPDKKIINYMFEKHFSYKKDGHFGMGLYIAQKWLESVNYQLGYNTSNNTFEIKIPIKRNCYER